jgi:hypothetical protein
MELLELFKSLNWGSLIVAGVITTFVVSAINTLNLKVSSNKLVFFISVLITLLSTTFLPSSYLEEGQVFNIPIILTIAQKIILSILVTMSFSILFYNYLGKLFLDRLFDSIKRKILEKFPGLTEDNNSTINPPTTPNSP